jgi:hypothetical protein
MFGGSPAGIAIDQTNNIYFDNSSYRILKVNPSGILVESIGNGTAGIVDGPANTARIGAVDGIAVDLSGVIYFTDNSGGAVGRVRRVVVSDIGYNLELMAQGSTGPTGPTGGTGPTGPSPTIQYGSATTNETTFLSAITFTTAYPSIPNITATVSDGTDSFVSIGSAATTGFTAYTWDGSAGVSAAFNWLAIL